MTRRYRASFLLQLVIVLAAVAAFLALLSLVEGQSLTVAIVVLVVGVVALELEILPFLLEWWLLRWARRHAPSPSSHWFVDVEAESKRDRESRRGDVDQNPSLW
jgi:hypothetical protein